jgi:hypothetical protein
MSAKNTATSAHDTDTKATVWIKYECRNGNRWTAVNSYNGIFADVPGRCVFSGCDRRHTFWAVGETKDREEVNAWFRDANAERNANDQAEVRP